MSETVFDVSIQQLGDQIVGLTLLQAKSLVDYLRTVHGIEPAGAVVAAPAAAGPAGAVPVVEEKTEFDVVLTSFGDNKYVRDAINWVNKNFTDNPGSLENFFWPTTHDEAKSWLSNFIEKRLENFGPYEDSADGQAVLQYHSGLSVPLNIGLINPQEIIDSVLASHGKKPIDLPSLEGFIRRIIGKREYVRALYITQQISMRTSPSLGQTRNLGSAWWTGETGIPPLDDVIKKIQANAYAHHTERLMIVGNLMMLCETKPTENLQMVHEFVHRFLRLGNSA